MHKDSEYFVHVVVNILVPWKSEIGVLPHGKEILCGHREHSSPAMLAENFRNIKSQCWEGWREINE